MKILQDMTPLDWRTMRTLYHGTYDGPKVEGVLGNAVIRDSKLYWLGGTSEGVKDSWYDRYCCPPREFEFTFESDDGFDCRGYYDAEGYHYWTGREMTAKEISSVNKKSIKYVR